MTETPFTYQRTVQWADCDPAGIIYTPRVLDIAMEALDDWMDSVVGADWITLTTQHDCGAPTVRTEIDFIRPPRPKQKMSVTVRVERIGNSSVTYIIDGYADENLHYFQVKLVSCYIVRSTMKPLAIPADMRARMVAYQEACGDQ